MATRHRRTVGQTSKSRAVRQRRGFSLRGRGQTPSRSQVVLVYVFLGAITWLIFGQTVRHDFVNFDDHVYIYDNPLVTGGLTTSGIVSAFTHPHARNWHPLTTVSHMLDCQLYGLNAGGHHFTSVALHTIAVLLLFREVLRTDLEDMAQTVRAKRGPKLPTVLSVAEIQALLATVEPEYRLMVKLLYGSGLRLMELLRLRVKDIDFDAGLVMVRSGKGDKDRMTLLPASLHEELRTHLAKVRKIGARFTSTAASPSAGSWSPRSPPSGCDSASTRWP